MRAGLLNERINILRPVIVKSETGTETTNYELSWTTRARQTYSGGDRTNENGDIFFSHTVNFEIRRFYDFDELHRIEWRGRQYRILCIERNRPNQGVEIRTELIND